MSTSKLRTSLTAVESVGHFKNKYHDYEYPKNSIIIPTYNCSSTISLTLDRLLIQDYPDYEVIIVDGGSTDRTLEIVQGYRNEKILTYTVSGYQRYEMLNKGISQASGQYLNFIFPGDFYLYKDTLKYMMSLALEHQKPQLVFCGTLLRDPRADIRILFRHLSLRILRRGQQPSSLQSCWFHEDTFQEIGKFDTSYTMRGGYDLLCRFCLHGHLRAISTKRIFIDYDIRVQNQEMVIHHFSETFRTIYKYFGLWSTIRWFFIQRDWIRFLSLWWRRVKMAFNK